MTTSAYHLHGVMVESGQPTDLWIVGDTLTYDKVPGATTLVEDGWILPGLVDAHCHIGLGPEGPVDQDVAESQGHEDLNAGVTLVRDAGSPIDTHWLDGRTDVPRIIRAGRHVARTRRYLRGYAVEVDPEDLVETVRLQARAGDGWVKLVGDWIDRNVGDLAPSWPVDIMAQAVQAAHEEGARVTAHCFGEESVYHLVRAGIDCIEHGCGLDQSTVDEMVSRRVALVPTLDNLNIFPGIADQAEDKFPVYAAHMRDLYRRRRETMTMAIDAGVQVYAGSDAGGIRSHGSVIEEISALSEVGGAEFALGAAAWRARTWLGEPSLEEGAPADLIVAPADPRQDVSVLSNLSLVVRSGSLAAGPVSITVR
ncbi:MAG: amidohydrolase family protein [Propionibacteriaceae bacterium]|nr:amidohydrolase family protein [Propionibacteriaceae bacterium]